MSLISLRCPNCNGDIRVDDNLDYGFCMYCGSKILIKTTINVEMDGIDSKKNLVRRAEAFMMRGNYSEAQKIYEKMISEHPESLEGDLGVLLAKIENTISEIKVYNNTQKSFDDYDFPKQINDYMDEGLLVIDTLTGHIRPQNNDVTRYYSNMGLPLFKYFLFTNSDELANENSKDNDIVALSYIDELEKIKRTDNEAAYSSKINEVNKRLQTLQDLCKEYNIKNKHDSKTLFNIIEESLNSVLLERKRKLAWLYNNKIESINQLYKAIDTGDSIIVSGGSIFVKYHGKPHIIAKGSHVHSKYYLGEIKSIDKQGDVYIDTVNGRVKKGSVYFDSDENLVVKKYSLSRERDEDDELFRQHLREFIDIKRCPFCFGKLHESIIIGQPGTMRCLKCLVKIDIIKYRFINR